MTTLFFIYSLRAKSRSPPKLLKVLISALKNLYGLFVFKDM